MNKNKTLAFVAAALMALSFSSACSKNKKDASTTPAATEPAPAAGGDATNPCGGAANPCGGAANPCGGAANPCGGSK
jgi:hypothetical protein